LSEFLEKNFSHGLSEFFGNGKIEEEDFSSMRNEGGSCIEKPRIFNKS